MNLPERLQRKDTGLHHGAATASVWSCQDIPGQQIMRRIRPQRSATGQLLQSGDTGGVFRAAGGGALSDRLGRKLTLTKWRLPYLGGGMAPLQMVAAILLPP